MYWNVRRLSNKPTIKTKERTGKVTPLLDVGGITTSSENHAHLLCNSSERASKEFQADWIYCGFFAHILPRSLATHKRSHYLSLFYTLGNEISYCIDLCSPLRRQDCCRIILRYDSRSFNGHSRHKLLSFIYCCIMRSCAIRTCKDR